MLMTMLESHILFSCCTILLLIGISSSLAFEIRGVGSIRTQLFAVHHNNHNHCHHRHPTTRKRYRPLHHAPRHGDPLAVERDSPQSFIFGSDESGTGCLAGPVVAATCWINDSSNSNNAVNVIAGVLDGKRLSREQRDEIYHQILQRPDVYHWTTAVRTSREIEEAESVSHAIVECFRDSIEAMVTKLNLKDKKEESVLSIVDGPSSPKGLSVPSRPWVGGDNVVYSVAIASILAQKTRDNLMQEAAVQYPQYGFDRNFGYHSAEHEAALAKHGPSPIHRASCKRLRRYRTKHSSPWMMTTTTTTTTTKTVEPSEGGPSILRGTHAPAVPSLDRDSFLNCAVGLILASVAMMTSTPPLANAIYKDNKTGIRLPELGEIESAIPVDWTDMNSPLDDDDDDTSKLGRLDSSSDAIFYKDPRFVEHVDVQAVTLLTQYIAQVLSQQQQQQQGKTSVLDLCSSWTSHFPAQTPTHLERVVGLGMNAKELEANPSLTAWVVQDLNENPRLPFSDNSFDVIFCQLSIDYLTQPLQICREMGRVLKPNGSVHILFSNRLFLQKAVALWTGADDIDHTYTVGAYLHFCCQPGLFRDIQAKDLSVRNRAGRIMGDPLYVVTAVKA